MGDKKLTAIQSANGYSNQLTTSDVVANSLAIYQTLSLRNRVVDIPGWLGTYYVPIAQFHWPSPRCAPAWCLDTALWDAQDHLPLLMPFILPDFNDNSKHILNEPLPGARHR